MAPPPLDLYIVTFNCGRTLIDLDAFSSCLFKAHKASDSLPDVVVLSLQEVAPIAYSYLGGSFLAPHFAYYVKAVQRAAGSSKNAYRHIITHNVGMTAIMVFVKPDLSDSVKWIQTAEVGVGWSETGNKGAAAVRLAMQSKGMQEPVPITLIAAHLAPMEDAWERRNEDWKAIVRGLCFKDPNSQNTVSLSIASPPSTAPEEAPLLTSSLATLPSNDNAHDGMFISGSPVFFAGDLNYRSGDAEPDDAQKKAFPQPCADPSDPLHFSHSLLKDQLVRERKAGNTLHSLDEASISFGPTYKFSSMQQTSMSRDQFLSDEEPEVWFWATHRLPSWCDRVLFSSALKDSIIMEVTGYTSLSIQPTSDHRPVALSCRLDLEKAKAATADQQSPLDLDPEWEGRRVAARRREIAIGVVAYLGLTWEGNGLMLASIVGVVGGWLALTSMILTSSS